MKTYLYVRNKTKIRNAKYKMKGIMNKNKQTTPPHSQPINLYTFMSKNAEKRHCKNKIA